METFLSELTHQDPKLRLNALNNLGVVAKGLGKDGCLNSLLPTLRGILDDEDELLHALAEQLASFPKYIGEENSYLLLDYLEFLCRVEETVVRTKAIESMEIVSSSVSDLQMESLFIPILKRLAEDEWFSPKCSACAIFHLAFSRLPELHEDLVVLYKNLCAEETPLVRRSSATHLATFLPITPPDLLLEHLLESIKSFEKDEQDSVRLLVVDLVIGMTKCFNTSSLTDKIKIYVEPILSSCVQDKSWRVRYTVASKFDQIAAQFGPDLVQDTILPLFVELLKDVEGEVRSAICGKLSHVCKCIPVPILVEKIFPILGTLVVDDSQLVREAVASEVILLSSQFGLVGTKENLMPLLLQLLKDDVANVRMNVVRQLEKVIPTVGKKEISENLIPAIVELSEDKQWRVRLGVIEFMAPLAKHLDLDFFLERLAPLCFGWLHDPVYRVRYNATANLKQLVQVLGISFYHNVVHQKLEETARNTNYLYRSTALWSINELLEILPVDLVQEKLLPIVLSLANDPVPNIRLNVVSSLEILAKSLSPSTSSQGPHILNQVLSTLKKLEGDQDLGVRESATAVVTLL
eukprot:TRINITY_DN2081_c0_g1_i22.p1 TRINITY_DN2081_c0_g1~~TRINITY_DN2081_c0_g1_i22.p1  ORF type:complete len:579 (+),score=131.11 TRINITY_DN2081_c0_g1_i22:65-1801(+)